ncbi:MAG: hypothetical protein K1X57_14305 [Gemmataceae bacterium]|nr:hypothetical protein [Gemmataceae bacterium]
MSRLRIRANWELLVLIGLTWGCDLIATLVFQPREYWLDHSQTTEGNFFWIWAMQVSPWFFAGLFTSYFAGLAIVTSILKPYYARRLIVLATLLHAWAVANWYWYNSQASSVNLETFLHAWFFVVMVLLVWAMERSIRSEMDSAARSNGEASAM